MALLEYGIDVVGQRALIRNLDQMPLIVQDILHEKMTDIADRMLGDLQLDIDEKMIGDDSTGELSESTHAYVTQEGGSIQLVVGFDGSVDYARIQDKGGTTSPHMIFPNKGKVLAFMGGQGKMGYATRIFHPGATLAPKNYLKDLRRQYAAEVSKEIKKSVIQGIRARMRGQA